MTSPSLPKDPGKPSVPSITWYWIGGLLGVTLLSIVPLYHWIRFAIRDDLYSHTVIIPLISGYLIWCGRKWPPAHSKSTPFTLTVAAAGVVTGLLLAWGVLVPFPNPEHTIDAFAGSMMGYALGLGSVTLGVLGWRGFRSVFTSWLMIGFMIPLPAAVLEGVEHFLQIGSASMAAWLFRVAETPVLLNGLILKLPGITLQVARECSGIHSTTVLFITATTAAFVFLQTLKSRLLLIGIALPLALLRNGFRVFTLGELAVRSGPEVLDSWVHHDGGPVFFALSLIPFGLILWALILWERAARRRSTDTKPV